MAIRNEKVDKIRTISLNLSYYSGQDEYSDGDYIEERMLEIAKRIADDSEDEIQMQEKYNQAIMEEKDWAVLYHFSHIRGNIIEPIELDRSMHVLELGSGCGAVTGKLAEKVEKVTCIELSKRRSLINAYKNCMHNNIEIIVGNFQEIEKDLEKYDVITMIGVFEYAAAYIQDIDSYRTFLQLAMNHLSNGGKLVIAIENKLGMKYFAGCKEDHTGILFGGIEGYTEEKKVKTFSKKELNDCLIDVGLHSIMCYYPYPDYKFPFSFYSEDRLPESGELFMNQRNFDRDRMLLFDEMKVYQSVIEAGLFGEFSNSFLIEAVSNPQPILDNTYQVIYKKCSNDRDLKYAVFTDICLDSIGDRKVIKYPMSSAGNKHLKHMHSMGKKMNQIFEGSKIQICDSDYKDNILVMKFIFGKTFEKYLDDLIGLGEIEQAKEELRCFIENLKSMAVEQYYVTEEYKSFFGENYPEHSMGCIPVTNIDMIPSNIFCEKGKWIVVDYEWSFDFPIPVEYVIYRIMFYYINSSSLRKCLKIHDFFCFSQEDMLLYERMEHEFQDSICRKIVSIEKFYRIFGKDAYSPLVKIDELQRQMGTIKSENDALTQNLVVLNNKKEILAQKISVLNNKNDHLVEKNVKLVMKVDSLKMEKKHTLQENMYLQEHLNAYITLANRKDEIIANMMYIHQHPIRYFVKKSYQKCLKILKRFLNKFIGMRHR